MESKKILGLIGFSARSRKVAYGADMVEQSIKKRKTFLVIVAKDASERTKDKFIKLCDTYSIPIIIERFNIEELSKAIGKSNKAILGIEEINLSKEIQKINNGGEIIG